MLRRHAIVALALVLAAGCRTTRSSNEAAIPALAPSGSVIESLKGRLNELHAIRALTRIRATSGGKTQSFRAQLLVDARGETMLLEAYTPVGTGAMTLFADGDRVTFVDHLNETAWEGSAAELARGIAFFDPSVPPAVWALDALGFPMRGEFEAAAGGLAKTRVADVVMTFDPPSFPPHNVVVERGGEKLEITYLELMSTDATPEKPSIPRTYQRGLPRL